MSRRVGGACGEGGGGEEVEVQEGEGEEAGDGVVLVWLWVQVGRGLVRARHQCEELPAVPPPAAELEGGGGHRDAPRSVCEAGLE